MQTKTFGDLDSGISKLGTVPLHGVMIINEVGLLRLLQT